MKESIVHSSIPGREVRPVKMSREDVGQYYELGRIGINLTDGYIRDLAYAMDASDDVGVSPAPLSNLTTASIGTPIQMLQAWLPGFVEVITAARKIDEIVGIQTVGSPEDEQIVQMILEQSGTAQPYADYGQVPFGSWNPNFETRTIFRFEHGMSVGWLEDARAGKMNVSTAAVKRAQAAKALDIQRNRLGFYGWNDGSGKTYGFLNDPGLPGYNTVATGTGGYLWSQKNWSEITADIRTAMAGLQTQSMDNIDPASAQITCAVSMAVYQYLNVMAISSSYVAGMSVREWCAKNYPGLRFVSAPELDGANGGANVAVFFVDSVPDGGTDGGATFVQMVQSKFQALGVEKRAKSYIEDYMNASAGVMCKRPFAVYRISGI